MFPLKDSIPSKSKPVVNWILIIINITLYIYEFLLPEAEFTKLIYQYGIVPRDLSENVIDHITELNYKHFIPFFSNIFLHGSLFHLLGNIWFLYIFGDNVEDRMGHFRYFLFYILCGVLAGLTHFVLYIHSPVPAIGASGAISGIMAAYMFLFPSSRIITFIPIFIFIPLLLPIPAFIFIGIWFFWQLYSGSADLLYHNTATGIAFWAHIGGFVAGLLLFKFFITKKKISY